MTIEELMWISLAVSLDAFGVAIALGLNNRITAYNKMLFALSFGFFQFLFSFLGGIGGKIFTEKIASVPAVVGGSIISIVGLLMIKDGNEEKQDNLILSSKMYIILGISVSIDAMVVGFITFSSIQSLNTITSYTGVVGLFTLFMSGVAFIISKYLRKINVVGKYADYIGGIILILFGLKMILF